MLFCCYSVEVIVVLIGEDNKILTADEAVKELSNSETQANLNNSGFIISDEFTTGMRIIHDYTRTSLHCT